MSMYADFIKECVKGKVIETNKFFYSVCRINKCLYIRNVYIKPRYRNTNTIMQLKNSIFRLASKLKLKHVAGEINIDNPHYSRLLKFGKEIGQIAGDDYKTIICIEVNYGR